jgi:transcriptional regulator with XRE-family HTH domain
MGRHRRSVIDRFLGHRLKELRLRVGMTQQQVAGSSVSAISRYTSLRRVPTGSRLPSFSPLHGSSTLRSMADWPPTGVTS